MRTDVDLRRFMDGLVIKSRDPSELATWLMETMGTTALRGEGVGFVNGAPLDSDLDQLYSNLVWRFTRLVQN